MLEIKGISKRFDSIVALDDVSLTIDDGELFVLLGPSGCGKTTLLRLIGGLESPDNGEIWLDGKRVDNLPPHKRSIHTVFQNYALFPHLTVFDNVAFGPRLRRQSETQTQQLVKEILELVKMWDWRDAKPQTLSGGQKQRVALARALVNKPKIVLLDEPLSALDQKLRLEMQAELVTLQRRLGLTFILVTHDQDEAMGMSDRICVLHQGRIQQISSGEELYTKPRNQFVAEFFGLSNVLEVVVSEINADSIVVKFADKFHLRLPDYEWISHKPLTVGLDTKLIIRPENINMLASEHPGLLPVEIKKTHFKGPMTELICEVLDYQHKPLSFHLPSDEAVAFKEDQRVYVEFSFDAILIPDD